MRWFRVVIMLACFVTPAHGIPFDELLDSYGVLETVAGTGLFREKAFNGWLPSMEGGLAIEAELSRPHMTMADVEGNLYIADKDAHAVRMVDLQGRIHTIAGTSESGYNGNGTATDSQLSFPNGLYTLPNGTTYILDLGNAMIRRLSDGVLTTVYEDPFGMATGRGLWVSPDEETIFYSAGTEIRKWTADRGAEVYAAGFVELGNLHVDPQDQQLVVTDREGHGVYKVFEDGSRTLIAGNETTGGGGPGLPATSVGLKEVRGVWFHPRGGYFLATHDGGQVWFVDDEDVIHLLIDGDDDGTHAGDGLPLTTPGRKISEPRAVTMAPNGDLLVTEHDAGFIRRIRVVSIAGDYDRDGVLDVDDLDLLSDALRQGDANLQFDANHDGSLSLSDRVFWIEQIQESYLGDSNFDGQFDSGDLVQVFQRGHYEDQPSRNLGYADGDWNGDGQFNSQDFVAVFQAGGYDLPPRTAVRAVPEPGMAVIWKLAFVLLLGHFRRFVSV